MDHWLEPSLVATLTVTMVMFLSFCYLYFQERERSLLYFSVAWLVYSVRFVVRLVNIHFPIPYTAEAVNYFSNLLNSGLLIIGVHLLFRWYKKFYVPILLISSTAVITLLFLLNLSSLARTTIIFAISGACYIYIGIRLLRLFKRNSIYIILGINFILWGLHKFDYPAYYHSAELAPFGYLLAILFSIIAAQGFHVLYYQTAKNALRTDRERLTSLLEIIKIDDIEKLLDEALSIALKVTNSRYGFIHHYSEDDRIFKFNTWSKEVHTDCRVIEKQSTYNLSETGCWGEAVRQRKPFIINDYSSDNRYKKGTPEGHVEIKKFLTVPFFSDGEIVAVIGVANKPENYNEDDIRQLSLLLNNVWKIVEVKEYQQKLEEARNRAEESNNIKTAFLANISHELRTPLNGTLGMLSLLLESDDAEKNSVYAEMAYKSSEDMLYLVEDILMFSQYNAKRLKPDISEFDVVEDLRSLAESNRKTAELKGISIGFDCDISELKIRSDKIKLNQIVINIINNAIKFSDRGHIAVSAVKSDEELTISVKDEGIGIPEDKLWLIFEPFYQLEDPFTKTHKGIGAGLSIVKSLCDLLDISISIESAIGGGTAVNLTFKIIQ